jgi:1-deoxy-D-xylulose 5-phosphate reductoisomerase
VAAFLEGRIGFRRISSIVEETLDRMPAAAPCSIPDVLNIDEEARRMARNVIESGRTVVSTAARVPAEA